MSDKIGQLKLPATDGKYYETDCANTEALFRSESKEVAVKGGTIAGNTRRDIEKQLGESVVSGKKAQDKLLTEKKKVLK